jgi:hypothetical protein
MKQLDTQLVRAGNELLPQELHWGVNRPPRLEDNILCEMWQVLPEPDSDIII